MSDFVPLILPNLVAFGADITTDASQPLGKVANTFNYSPFRSEVMTLMRRNIDKKAYIAITGGAIKFGSYRVQSLIPSSKSIESLSN